MHCIKITSATTAAFCFRNREARVNGIHYLLRQASVRGGRRDGGRGDGGRGGGVGGAHERGVRRRRRLDGGARGARRGRRGARARARPRRSARARARAALLHATLAPLRRCLDLLFLLVHLRYL